MATEGREGLYAHLARCPRAEKGHQGHSHSDLCLSSAKMRRLSGSKSDYPSGEGGSPFEFLVAQSSRKKENQVCDTAPLIQREISAVSEQSNFSYIDSKQNFPSLKLTAQQHRVAKVPSEEPR